MNMCKCFLVYIFQISVHCAVSLLLIQPDECLKDLQKVNIGYKNKNVTSKALPNVGVPKSMTEIMTINEHRKNLKCGIKIIALSIMRIITLEMKDVKLATSNVVYYAAFTKRYFSVTSRNMLQMLYNLNYRELYDMWLFHLNIKTWSLEYDTIPTSAVVKLNNWIMRLLEKSTEKCTGDSIFDITNSSCAFYKVYNELNGTNKPKRESVDNLKKYFALAIRTQFAKIEHPVINNSDFIIFDNCRYLSLDNKDAIGEQIIDRIYSDVGYLRENYIKHMKWGDASVLLNYYLNEAKAKKFNEKFIWLGKFNALLVDQMTIIMLRMTWTHLILMDDVIKNCCTKDKTDEVCTAYVKSVNSKILQDLCDFTSILGLKNNVTFRNVINFFNCDIKEFSIQKQTTEQELINQLNKICSQSEMHCNATETMDTNPQNPNCISELYQHHANVVLKSKTQFNEIKVEKSVKNNISRNQIIITTFVYHLKLMLQNVDINMMNVFFGTAKTYKNIILQIIS